jgi:hypothetical protein
MNITIYIAIWTGLALIVLGMAIYRNLLGIHEPTLHISGAGAVGVTAQTKQFKTEDLIEHWGQRLTMLVVLYGFALAAIYLYKILVL